MSTSTNISPAMKRPIFVDTDPGIDDTIALCLALKSPNVTVVGLGIVAGNSSMANHAANALRCISVLPESRRNIPIFKGMSCPLLGKHRAPQRSDFVHGKDGLRDSPDLAPPRKSDEYVSAACSTEHAAQALIRLSHQYTGNLELIALGPLTNIAMAVRFDPTLPSRIKKFTIMGGNIFSVGNSSAAAEYNFMVDPEAAFIVIEEFSTLADKLLIYSWEAAVRSQLDMPDLEYDSLFEHSSTYKDFYKLITAWIFDKSTHASRHGDHSVILASKGSNNTGNICDFAAMVAHIYPESLLETDMVECGVELDGYLTRGMLLPIRSSCGSVPEHKALKVDKTKIRIAIESDKEIMLERLKQAFSDKFADEAT